MLATHGGAAREDTVPQKQRAVERLVKVRQAILLVQQVVAEERSSPAVRRPADREARAKQGIGRLKRLRVIVRDDPLILLRKEAQVRRRVPRPSA